MISQNLPLSVWNLGAVGSANTLACTPNKVGLT
jgi:hypothetical protein